MSGVEQSDLVTYQKDGKTYQRRKRREFTDEFKKQIVELYHTGKGRTELIREYDLSETALGRWIKRYDNSGSFKAKDNRTEPENELIRLQKEVKKLRMENDILKQAALILGEHQKQQS